MTIQRRLYIPAMLVFFLSPLTTGWSFAQVPAIGISINSTKDTESYDKSPVCKVSFNIYNNSAPGTVERLSVPVSFTDDRGRVVSVNAMQSKIQNKGSGFAADRTRIPVGQSLVQTDTVWVKEECQYLGTWTLELAKVEDAECSIRMWPEDVSCASLLGVQPLEQ